LIWVAAPTSTLSTCWVDEGTGAKLRLGAAPETCEDVLVAAWGMAATMVPQAIREVRSWKRIVKDKKKNEDRAFGMNMLNVGFQSMKVMIVTHAAPNQDSNTKTEKWGAKESQSSRLQLRAFKVYDGYSY
jgi:hypothetical protein